MIFDVAMTGLGYSSLIYYTHHFNILVTTLVKTNSTLKA